MPELPDIVVYLEALEERWQARRSWSPAASSKSKAVEYKRHMQSSYHSI